MNASINIYDEISKKISAEEPFVLATIVKTKGSSPREAGAKMLVNPDGTIHGTIGGGTFEKRVIEDSLELFKTGEKCELKTYKFSQGEAGSTGMACGGEARVFLERNSEPDRLFIFGGGHIGTCLAKTVEELSFRVTVIDDKQEVLKKFHSPAQTILTDEDYDKDFPEIDHRSYIVIVTRNHSSDMAVLQKVLMHDCAYIGMIGSKNKVRKMFFALEEKGIDRKRLEKVHAPIGLSIGAEGPEEIAISIAGELIKAKRQRS